MRSDEEQRRQLVTTWIAASQAGDVERYFQTETLPKCIILDKVVQFGLGYSDRSLAEKVETLLVKLRFCKRVT